METESQAKERKEDEKWEKEMKILREENKRARANRLARRNALKNISEDTDHKQMETDELHEFEDNKQMETDDVHESEESESEDENDSILKAVKTNQAKIKPIIVTIYHGCITKPSPRFKTAGR